MKEGALIAKTINHIGAVDEERKRIETAGGVCREDAPGHFRLFLPGEASRSNLPPFSLPPFPRLFYVGSYVVIRASNIQHKSIGQVWEQSEKNSIRMGSFPFVVSK